LKTLSQFNQGFYLGYYNSKLTLFGINDKLYLTQVMVMKETLASTFTGFIFVVEALIIEINIGIIFTAI
jgi:hypothetical protein